MRISTSVQSPYLDFDYAFVDFEEGEIGEYGHHVRFVSLDNSPGLEILTESDLTEAKNMIARLDKFFLKTDAKDLYEKYESANIGEFNVLVHAWTQKTR